MELVHSISLLFLSL